MIIIILTHKHIVTVQPAQLPPDIGQGHLRGGEDTPNLPTNIVPTNIARLKLSGESSMDIRIPPL